MKKYIRGFTLVEVLISLGILMIISSLMLVVTGTGRLSWSTAAAKLYLTSQERQASAIIQQELSLSKYVTKIFVPTGESVRFQIPLVKLDGSLDLTAVGDLKWGDGDTEDYYIEYVKEVDANNLLRRVLDASLSEVNRRVIAHGVQNFNVTILPDTRQYQVTIDFSIDRYLGGRLTTPINNDVVLYVTPMN
jgi:type II secretory pathway pseudopilin PulG